MLMFYYNLKGVLEVDELELTKKLNSCNVKHFTKLNSNNKKIQDIYKLFKENNFYYIFNKLQTIYWLYFEKNELEDFNHRVIDKIINIKKGNVQLKFDVSLQNIIKDL